MCYYTFIILKRKKKEKKKKVCVLRGEAPAAKAQLLRRQCSASLSATHHRDPLPLCFGLTWLHQEEIRPKGTCQATNAGMVY